MRATLNAQATQNVNARLSSRVAGIRTQQPSRLRQLHEHLRGSWRCFGERALKRISHFKAYWHRAMSCVQRDADSRPGVDGRLAWIPVRSVVV